MQVFEGNWNGFKLGGSNKSLTYILPMLGSKSSEFISKYFPTKQFVNVFIGDVEKPELKDVILLLYEFSGHIAFLNFEERLQMHQQYRGQYKVDHKHDMYIFEVPEERITDYDNFKRSKYSKFEEKYKKHIGMFHSLQLQSPIMQVLYKGEGMYKFWEEKVSDGVSNTRIPREQECGTAIKLHEEYYQPEYKLTKVITKLKEFEDGN